MDKYEEIKKKVIMEINDLTNTSLEFDNDNEQRIDLDSFTRVNLLARLEDHYNIIISSDDLLINTFNSISNIVYLIQKVLVKNV